MKLMWLITRDAQYLCREWFVPVFKIWAKWRGKPVVWQHEWLG